MRGEATLSSLKAAEAATHHFASGATTGISCLNSFGQPTSCPGAISGGALFTLIVMYLVAMAFLVLCYYRIFKRAGWSGWWAVTLLVPVVNLVVIGMFAFSKWPLEARLESTEQAFLAETVGSGFTQLSSGGKLQWEAVQPIPPGAAPGPGAARPGGAAADGVRSARAAVPAGGGTGPVKPVTPAAAASGPGTPAGWYPAKTPGFEQYWDGAKWTDQTRPLQS